MLPDSVQNRLPEIHRTCTQLGVHRLAFFGSILREDFGPGSDVDVLVEFGPHRGHTPFEQYFELKERLERLFGHPVDLVTKESIRNPVFRLAVERNQLPVHGESQAEAAG